jgi:hypothetical protein
VADRFAEADQALERGDNAGAAAILDQHLEEEAADAAGEWARLQPGGGQLQRKLSMAEDLVRPEPRERLIALDAVGCVTVYLRGSGSYVPLPLSQDGTIDEQVLRRLEGAYCLTHNHPSGPLRPIGGTVSLNDMVMAQRFRIGQLRVAAREATYTLRPKTGHSWDPASAPATQRAYRHHQASLDRAMTAAPGTATRDIYFYLRVFDFLMIDLARRLNLEYQRIDRPRREWVNAIPSPSLLAVQPETSVLVDDTDHFRWLSSVLQTRRA